MMALHDMALTDRERTQIKAGVRAYDLRCKAELKETRDTPDTPTDYLARLGKIFIDDALEDIRFLTRDIALMTRTRETAEGKTLRLCKYILGEDLLRIQEQKRTIERFRHEYPRA